MAWTVADMPSQKGRRAIVTGANTGLGLDTAAELAAKGADVVLACRTRSKADAAKAEIESRTSNGSVEVLDLDLGDLGQIAEAAAETVERFDRIDLLVNNAGVMIPPYSTTADGFELQFGTNHLGHFAYTAQIFPTIGATAGSRIVTVSSIAHKQGRMRWDDLQWTSGYNRMKAYGQSKLANLLFTFELDRRLRSVNHDTIALAAHPGVSATELARYIPGANLPVIKDVFGIATRLFGQSAADGALPTLRAATDPEAEGSEYYGPALRNEMAGPPVLTTANPHAYRVEDWARLWSVSEELTGVEFDVA